MHFQLYEIIDKIIMRTLSLPKYNRLFFKLSLKGMNPEFSFFCTGCHTKVKEPSLP